MTRRRFLRHAGLAGVAGVVGVASVGGLSREQEPGPESQPQETPTETPRTVDGPGPVRYADRYGTVVDAVEAGADPEGKTPINDVVEAHVADDTLLSFPGGTYLIQPLGISGISNFGIAASYDDPPTFVPARGACRPASPYLLFTGIEDFLLDGVTFDFTRIESGGPLYLFPEGESAIRKVRVTGSCREQITTVRIDVNDEDDETLVENLVAENDDGGSELLTGVYVGKNHAGTLTFRDCRVRGFSNNGLYASAPGNDDGRDGEVHVVGGRYENNNISGIRLGSTGATARDASVVVDESPPANGAVNARGIRLRGRRGQLVEGCDVYVGPGTERSFGAVVVHPDTAGATVRATEMTVDHDTTPALQAFPPSRSVSSRLVLEDLTIDGDSAGAYAALVDSRDGTVFRDCTITQPGDDRGGIYLRSSSDCRIVDCRIDVTGNPLVLRGTTVRVENTTLVTPDGEEHIEEMEASDEDFTPRGEK